MLETLSKEYAGIKFVKEIPATTKVRAIHLKVDKMHYQVVVWYMPTMPWRVTLYEANRNGTPIKGKKYLMESEAIESTKAGKAVDNDLERGVELLVKYLDGTK
jgi:hypothetical protein